MPKIIGRKCRICNSDKTKGHWCRDYDAKGNWTGMWLCATCYGRNYQRNDPNSQANLKKLLESKIKNIAKTRKCCKCGSDKTYIDSSGKSSWHRYFDEKGNWNGESFICYNCRYDSRKKKKEEIKNRKCHICENDKTYVDNSGIANWHKYKDDQGNWDKKSYICTTCYQKIRNKSPDSWKCLIKSMARCRIGKISRYEDLGKAIISQWIVAKTFGLKDNNIENDNFKEHIDLEKSPIFGSIDVKSGTLIGNEWRLHGFSQKCDNYVFVCMSHDWKNVEKIYIVPCLEIYGENDIRVYKNYKLLSRPSKWEFLEKYVKGVEPFSDMYHTVNIPEFFNPFDLWKGKYNIKVVN